MPNPIMSFSKPIAIISTILALSCHITPKSEITTSFDTHFEILHGKVKQLREVYREGKWAGSDTSITDFDIHGNALRTLTTGYDDGLVKYEYQYDKSGKKIEVTGKDSLRIPYFNVPLYKYDMNGRIVEMSSNSKELKENPDTVMRNKYFYLPKQDKWFYKYDAAGNRVQQDWYFEQKHMYRREYKYNEKHLLIEEAYFYGDDKKPNSKTSYHYTAFDSKGNWLRRVGMVTDFGPPAQEIPQPVVMRKITYY
jgi:hypothetical protein